jgi:hypothetical protein
MNRLAEKIIYFNNHYIYRIRIGIRVKFISEFNDIKVDITEYINVIDDRFNIFIDFNIDNFLIPINGRENWFFVFLIREIHVSILATISIENRITRILSRENAEFDFNIFLSLSRKHDDDRSDISYYSNNICN